MIIVLMEDGGSSTTAENEYINEGESINLSYTATKEGYEFIGWNTNKDAQEGLKELTMGTSDVTLYAIFRVPDTTPPVIENVSTSSTPNSITVVVTASDEESGISKYEFKINDNEWIDNGINNTYTFNGLTQNTGYDISVRVTNGVDLTAEEEVSASIKLTDNVVTTGDGLYKDSTEEGRYIYKGAIPNNYVNFNNELWRIISIETDGTMKIANTKGLSERAFDTAGNRSSTYCNNSSNGCNAWGSNSTTYDKNGSPVTAISDTYSSSSTYALPGKEASLNTYLNGDYYNSLISIAQNQIDNHYFNVGTVSASSSNTLETDMLEEGKYKWLGKIGLLNVTDYVKASTNSVCDSIYDYDSNTSCYNNSNNHNWLSVTKASYPRYINGSSGSRYNIWGLNHTSYNIGRNGTASANNYGILPALYLKNSVSIISGKGTSTEPYNLGTGVSTSVLDAPTFSEERINNGITVTITYPEGEGLVYEYQKDSGEWTTASQVQQVEFTENGTLVARVSDGVNIETASLTIKQDSAGSDLVESAGTVTSGDGLYADSYEENVYTYRGANPNNYVTFNGEQWRIISVNTADNTIKIMRNSVLVRTSYDEKSNRTTSSNQYCNYSSTLGCNIYGSTSSLYNQAGTSKISMLAREVGGTAYSLPANESSLSTYLNGEYYDRLSSASRDMVKEDALYKSGVLQLQSGQTTSTDISQVSAVKWKGKVGLIDATEYVRASTNSSCTGAYAYYNISSSGCRGDGESNWMFFNGSDYWTMSPSSGNTSYGVWLVYSHGMLYSNGSNSAGNSYGVRPVVTLSSAVKITGGNGSSSQPYQLTL